MMQTQETYRRFEDVAVRLPKRQHEALRGAEAPAGIPKETPLTPEARFREWEALQAKHSPSAYQTGIQAIAAKYSSPESATVIQKSVARYSVTYDEVKTAFDNKFNELEYKRREDLEKSDKDTHDELRKLKAEVDAVMTRKKENETEVVISRLTEDDEASKAKGDLEAAINKANEGEVRSRFEAYIDELNDRYMNVEWETGRSTGGWEGVTGQIPVAGAVLNPNARLDIGGIPILSSFTKSPVIANSSYESYAETFKSCMQEAVEKKLDMAFEAQRRATPEKLKQIQNYVENTYRGLASFDKDSSSISAKDIGEIQKIRLIKELDDGPRQKEFAELVHKGNLANLNVLYLFDNGLFENESEEMLEQILSDALKSGGQGTVIEFASGLSMAKNKGKITSFGQAEDYLGEVLDTALKYGAGATVAMLKKIHEGVSYEVSGKFKDATEYGRGYYRLALNGEIPLGDPQERVLVGFLNASRDGKSEILKSPKSRDQLFHAITAVREQYTEAYDKRYANARKPSAKSAQLEAIILMADEAEMVVKRFDTMQEHRGTYQELSDTKVTGKVPIGGFSKRDIRILGNIPPSTMAQNGWNVRDIGLLAAKWAGVFTIGLNIANSAKNASGDDFLDKWMNGVENALSNETVWGAAALVTATHAAQRNPELLEYFFANENEKGQIMTNVRLTWLEEKMQRVPGRPLANLVHSPDEWKAMKSVMAGGGVKGILEKANSRSKEGESKKKIPPILTKADFEGTIPSNILSQMNFSDPSVNRTRYLLWSSLVNSRNATDVDTLERWSKSYMSKKSI